MATDSMLRPGELKDILLKEIEAPDLGSMDVNDVGTVLEVKDRVALIYGLRPAIAGQVLGVTGPGARAVAFVSVESRSRSVRRSAR